MHFSTSVQFLKGVGPQLAKILSRRRIFSLADLVHYYPRTYEDRRGGKKISDLEIGELVSFKAQLVYVKSFQLGKTHRRIYDVLLKDNSGQVHCKFYRVPYKGYFERFSPYQEVRVVGKLVEYRGKKEFHHPDIKLFEENEETKDAIIPIYVEIENITTSKIHKLVEQSIGNLDRYGWEEEVFSKDFLEKKNLISLKEALKGIHQPDLQESKLLSLRRAPAQKRIIFEEFFWMELYLARKHKDLQREVVEPIPINGVLAEKVLKQIGFELTNAQKRVGEDIVKDFRSGHPMSRLIQGDVGSGKTLVALLAATHIIENREQVCLMVPTEILAEQHFKTATRAFQNQGVRIEILTGKSKGSKKNKDEILKQLKEGEVDLIIGTHALLEDPVIFKNLRLVIIDEQHRFGVAQRGILKQKGKSPHFLVMTATPIPRTLAMTVYGDLDCSVIDELPKGRSPIQTRVTYSSKRAEILKFVSQHIENGRQAYFVFPLVEESEKIDLKNAVEEFEKLKADLPHFRIGLLHGKMKSDEKDEIMERFRKNEIQILISTTVIEVGVDVPNANIMVVEHAERFGLSQLHQLRGRVGRGSHKSFCILVMGYAVSEEARERTRFMETTTDGFKVSEFDLEIRGPGEFLGTQQSGLPGFKMANLVSDFEILKMARDAAFELVQKDPALEKSENALIKAKIDLMSGPDGFVSIG